MVIANFEQGETSKKVRGIRQWDYGQVLRIQGLHLPTAVEIHFSLQESRGDCITRIGVTRDGVTDVVIPDSMVENEGAIGQEYYIYAWVYLTDETSGHTEYEIKLSVETRSKPEAFDKPEDAEIFREAIKAVSECADRAEEAGKSAEAARDEAQETADSIRTDVQGLVEQATQAKNTAVENANISTNNAEETEADRVEVAQSKTDIIQLKADTEQIKQDTLLAEQRVIQLMSTDTKSYFFTTIAQRDAATGIRNCDRCSVYETRADYIYDTENVDGDEQNPEWIKTSDWDALKSVAWDIITGKPNFATVATSGSYADLLDIPNRYNSPIVLDATADIITWDYRQSDTAVVTLTVDKTISISNPYNGCVACIQCYGAQLDFSDETLYRKSATFDYIEPLEAEHIMYTLIYNAGKWDVTAMVYTGGEASA